MPLASTASGRDLRWLGAALEQARQRGDGVAGATHLVDALLALPVSDLARTALTSGGVERPPRPPLQRRHARQVSSSHALHTVDAFARGLAIADGRREASSVDVLIALCWHPVFWVDGPDRRRRILRELVRLGATVPSTPLPRWERIEFTQSIEVRRGDLEAAIRTLTAAHPPGTRPRWAFNHKPRGMAVIVAEAGVDLGQFEERAST